MKKLLWIAKVMMIIIPSISLMCVNALAQEIRYITPEALKELTENDGDTVLIVDTQPKAAYKMGHIKGAINFPWAPEIKNPDLPRDRILVLYCDCTNEEDSTDLARQLLRNWEYVYVRVLKGGWSQWQKLGYPTEKSSED
ncbi:MAG TPA: rhodanese-like domain-containing protein [Thermodesulfobacteriota bacterium]|nr:rhodanese-like domain-containing protein [Thermodesulfobacteriota bacterium]